MLFRSMEKTDLCRITPLCDQGHHASTTLFCQEQYVWDNSVFKCVGICMRESSGLWFFQSLLVLLTVILVSLLDICNSVTLWVGFSGSVGPPRSTLVGYGKLTLPIPPATLSLNVMAAAWLWLLGCFPVFRTRLPEVVFNSKSI